MTDTTQTIISLKSDEVLKYFLESRQYHGFELPEYYNFDAILQYVKDTVADKPYEECITQNPAQVADVNLDILLNKDGHYAVRPMMLANPYLYYFLVRELAANWDAIKNCFSKYRVPNIEACSVPVVRNFNEKFFNSTTVFSWWRNMERKSVELSLDYRYMFVTDITNCYGTIIPQSIDWALALKDTAFETDSNKALSTNIKTLLGAMQKGHNIGIPQGSAVFDFVAEIVLGYSDLLLYETIKADPEITADYKILRYRDDYRVFCNDKDQLERISYRLQEVLESLNFRMNSQKTKMSDSIITDSIKPEKLDYIYNTPIINKDWCVFQGLQKHLLYILMFSRRHPNCGYLKVLLSDFDKRVIETLKPHRVELISSVDLSHIFCDSDNESDEKPEEEKSEKAPEPKYIEYPGRIVESVRALAAIATQIAVENVSSAHYALRVISRMVNSLKDEVEKWGIFMSVVRKLRKLPNSNYTQLWLQHITYQVERIQGVAPYSMRLCQLVSGKDVDVWNNSWLMPQLTEGFPIDTVADREKLNQLTPVIEFIERYTYDSDVEPVGRW